MTFYAVMSVNKQMTVNGQTVSLPDGVYYMPVFSDRKAAEDHAAGQYEVFPVLTLDPPKGVTHD